MCVLVDWLVCCCAKLWQLKWCSEATFFRAVPCLLYQESQEGVPGFDPCKIPIAAVPLTLYLRVEAGDKGHLDLCLRRCRAGFGFSSLPGQCPTISLTKVFRA